MANLFTAEAAGMADGLISSIDNPIVPTEFSAHAEAYLRAFYSVRISTGAGCRFSKDATPTATKKRREPEEGAPIAAARKPRKAKLTPAPKPVPAPTLPPKPPMEAALERLLQSA